MSRAHRRFTNWPPAPTGKALDFYRQVFGWQTETVSDTDEFRYSTELIVDNGGSVVRGAEDTPYGRLAAVADSTGAGFNLSSLEN